MTTTEMALNSAGGAQCFIFIDNMYHGGDPRTKLREIIVALRAAEKILRHTLSQTFCWRGSTQHSRRNKGSIVF